MFGEWNEWVAKYSPVFIIGAFFLYLLIRSFNWSSWKYHRSRRKTTKKKWIAISGIVVLVIGSGSYYHFVYNTPIKRIERLIKKYEENKKTLKAIDEITEHIESEEFQKEIEESN